MSKALQTLYASATIGDVPIHTLTLQSNTLGTIYLCQGFDDINAKLETNELVTFTACGLGLSLPQRSVKGRQDLQFQLCNVTGEVLVKLEAAMEAADKIKAIYRVYTASYLEEPAELPIEMTVGDVKANAQRVNVVASFNDLVNRAWPRDRYTPSIAPGLKYFS